MSTSIIPVQYTNISTAAPAMWQPVNSSILQVASSHLENDFTQSDCQYTYYMDNPPEVTWG